MPINESQRKTVAVKLRFKAEVAEKLARLASALGKERTAIVSELILAVPEKSTPPKKKSSRSP